MLVDIDSIMMNICVVVPYQISFYVMEATFKVSVQAASTFGRNAIVSFCQPAHDLKKSSDKTKFIMPMDSTIQSNED